MFEGNFYDQIDGVAMGSPLGPVLANLFLFWCWQIFCFSKSTAPQNKIHNWKTNWEPTFFFRFTHYFWWRQFSNFILSKKKSPPLAYTLTFLSFTPCSYKIGLVKTLLHRAFVISSNWSIFHLELNNFLFRIIEEIWW